MNVELWISAQNNYITDHMYQHSCPNGGRHTHVFQWGWAGHARAKGCGRWGTPFRIEARRRSQGMGQLNTCPPWTITKNWAPRSSPTYRWTPFTFPSWFGTPGNLLDSVRVFWRTSGATLAKSKNVGNLSGMFCFCWNLFELCWKYMGFNLFWNCCWTCWNFSAGKVPNMFKQSSKTNKCKFSNPLHPDTFSKSRICSAIHPPPNRTLSANHGSVRQYTPAHVGTCWHVGQASAGGDAATAHYTPETNGMQFWVPGASRQTARGSWGPYLGYPRNSRVSRCAFHWTRKFTRKHQL